MLGVGVPPVMHMSHRPHGDWASDITVASSEEGSKSPQMSFSANGRGRRVFTAQETMLHVSEEPRGTKTRGVWEFWNGEAGVCAAVCLRASVWRTLRVIAVARWRTGLGGWTTSCSGQASGHLIMTTTATSHAVRAKRPTRHVAPSSASRSPVLSEQCWGLYITSSDT